MDIILMALNVVIPLFIVMLVGYISRRAALINDEGVGATNRLLFWVFLPSILFISVYDTDLKKAFDLGMILYSVIFSTAVFTLGMVLVPRFEKTREKCGVIIQALIRGNEVYFGFPVIVSLIGAEYLGKMSMVIVFAVILFNAYSIIALEYFRGARVNVREMLGNILKNPMILATILAVFLNLTGITINAAIMAGINSLSQVATPLALFLLGASFNFAYAKGSIKSVLWVSFLRLVILPGIVVATTYWMGFPPTDTIILFVTFGVPTAVSGYSMAREMNADYELASQFVVFTSIFAVFTIFVWTVIFQFIELI